LGLFHGDLSLKNVLVDHETNVYLIDGGLGNADKTRNFGLLQPKTLYQFQQRDLKQLKNIKKQLLKPSLQTVTKKLNPDLRLLNGLKGVHLKLYISLIVKTFIALIIVYQQKAMVSDILLSKIILKSPLWINIEKLGKGNLWRYHNIIFTTTDKLKLTTHQGSEKKTQVLKINPGDNIVFEW
jgi:serine/threonine protein kinase